MHFNEYEMVLLPMSLIVVKIMQQCLNNFIFPDSSIDAPRHGLHVFDGEVAAYDIAGSAMV